MKQVLLFIQAKLLIACFSLIGLLPYNLIYLLSKLFGLLAYYLYSPFRKRTLSNLSLATDLHLTDYEKKMLGKKSMQNLLLTLLEYPYIKLRKGNISKIAELKNRFILEQMKEKYKAVIFLSAHQANWEVPFLELTTHTKALAIGKPIKNPYLYQWVTSLRQVHGGIMVTPAEAIKEASRALKQDICVGIVGDQGFTDSSYSGSFLGRHAWTSPIVAVLAYKFNKPILVGINKRVGKKQIITYSTPIIPNQQQPLRKEVKRMMDEAMNILEKSIKQNPQDWLWQHNRWKQPTSIPVKKPLRYESILITLPNKKEFCKQLIKELIIFDQIYPHHFITLFAPYSIKRLKIPFQANVHYYLEQKELFVDDPKYKLIFDFSGIDRLKTHFKKLGALSFITADKMGLKTKRDFQNFEKKFIHFVRI